MWSVETAKLVCSLPVSQVSAFLGRSMNIFPFRKNLQVQGGELCVSTCCLNAGGGVGLQSQLQGCRGGDSFGSGVLRGFDPFGEAENCEMLEVVQSSSQTSSVSR